MKAFRFLALMIVAMAMFSCTSAEDDFATKSSTDLMKVSYGAETSIVGFTRNDNVNSLSLAEVKATLESIRKSSEKKCDIQTSVGKYVDGGEYKTTTVGANSVLVVNGEVSTIAVALDFETTDGRDIYLGAKSNYNSSDFVWQQSGSTMLPGKNAEYGVVYRFRTDGYIAFQVRGEEFDTVKVPITFSGTYIPSIATGTYGMKLLKDTIKELK